MSTPPFEAQGHGPGPAAAGPGSSDPALAPSVPGAGHAMPGQPARHGTIAWALGFLAYIPVPFLGLIVAGIVQLVVGLRQRRYGGLAAVNGVRAANWGLTQLCWPVLMALAMTLGVVTGSPSPSGGVYFTPVAETLVFTVIGLYFLVAVMEAVYAIVGTVMASKGKRVPLPAIPFFRAPRG